MMSSNYQNVNNQFTLTSALFCARVVVSLLGLDGTIRLDEIISYIGLSTLDMWMILDCAKETNNPRFFVYNITLLELAR